ncbi:MAG: hypothetical protein ACOCQM_04685, partial [Natronomonas sp.]
VEGIDKRAVVRSALEDVDIPAVSPDANDPTTEGDRESTGPAFETEADGSTSEAFEFESDPTPNAASDGHDSDSSS